MPVKRPADRETHGEKTVKLGIFVAKTPVKFQECEKRNGHFREMKNRGAFKIATVSPC